MGTLLALWVVLGTESAHFLGAIPTSRAFLDLEWTPLHALPRYGAWPLVVATLWIAFLALAIACPLGWLSSLYLAGFADERAARRWHVWLELLAGVPTLAYGYVALAVVTPALQRVVPGLAGFNALSPAILLGLFLAPTVATRSAAALRAVPWSLQESAIALGSTPTHAFLYVVLPAARPGMIAAALLALGRALCEATLVAVAAGQQARFSIDPRASVETLGTYLLGAAQGDPLPGSEADLSLFWIGALLLALSAGTHALAQRARQRAP